MIFRDLGVAAYQSTCESMQDFTAKRTDDTEDEIWLLEHPPVFTQGVNGREEHILSPNGIPVVVTDRGGQVTYHGPGQLIAYTLIDLKRLNIGVRTMVSLLENSVVTLLADLGVEGKARKDAPGVYVENCKIASLGLRVKRGACYHGLSLNVAMDLLPFTYINPCGYKGMNVTDLRSLGSNITLSEVKNKLTSTLQQQF